MELIILSIIQKKKKIKDKTLNHSISKITFNLQMLKVQQKKKKAGPAPQALCNNPLWSEWDVNDWRVSLVRCPLRSGAPHPKFVIKSHQLF